MTLASFNAPVLLELGHWLQSRGYRFTTVTPATHQRVLNQARPHAHANEHDAFGWNRSFHPDLLPPGLFHGLVHAHIVQQDATGLWRSTVRWGSLDNMLFVHSAFPTDAADAVFFGPDTYRFASLIHQTLAQAPLTTGARILDMGCGCGPGGLVAARAARISIGQVALADINPVALAYARVNAALAETAGVICVESDLFNQVEGAFDLIVSNPPYLVDPQSRLYRHGGGPLGNALSERIVKESLQRLQPGGRLVLYTGSAIVDGRDPLHESILAVDDLKGWPVAYREIDPDVFGEELEQPAYAGVDRIAAVSVIVQRPRA